MWHLVCACPGPEGRLCCLNSVSPGTRSSASESWFLLPDPLLQQRLEGTVDMSHLAQRLTRSRRTILCIILSLLPEPLLYLLFHFFQKAKLQSLVVYVCQSLSPVPLFVTLPGSSCPWDFPGKNTGVGHHFLLQADLPYPAIEPGSPALAGRLFTIGATSCYLGFNYCWCITP